jgi:hypothetical protein
MKCPGCDLVLPDDDLQAQAAHMEDEHPEIITERMNESMRWDGWENQ